MSDAGRVVLVCADMVLAVGALLGAWEAARYARQAREAQQRADAAYAEVKRLREGR